ncbi:MAG: BRO family protein [Propionivibrio sp.]
MTLEGNPWFVAKDVCAVLDLNGYASQHTKRLDPSEVKVLNADSDISGTRDFLHLFDPKAPSASIISESGLYKLIMRSDKPQAKPFQDWVTQEVLPSIRRTGAFVKGQPSIKENPEMDPLDLVMAQARTITKDFNGLPIVFREDGYINMTKVADSFGKNLKDFFKTSGTQRYMKALSKMGQIGPNILKQATRGRTPGTYVCPELVVSYGQWISPQFNLKVIRTFLKLEKHGVVIHEKAVEDFKAMIPAMTL